MKLLLENWRGFLAERAMEPITPEEISDVPHGLNFNEVKVHLSNHFGKAKITLTKNRLDLETDYDQARKWPRHRSMKPYGIWYGCGPTWLDFIESEMPARVPSFPGTQIWALKIDMSNVKELITPKEIDKFTWHYKDMDMWFRTTEKNPDWAAVATDFDGIECCPYPVGDSDFKMKYMWYYGIDMPSGCIWNTKAITSSMLAAELKEDGWEVYV